LICITVEKLSFPGGTYYSLSEATTNAQILCGVEVSAFLALSSGTALFFLVISVEISKFAFCDKTQIQRSSDSNEFAHFKVASDSLESFRLLPDIWPKIT